MVDLLQLESVSSPLPKIDKTTSPITGEKRADPLDGNPTSTNSKYPSLRRAAIHFLTLLIRSTIQRLYDSPGEAPQIGSAVKRVRTTLGYIAATDEDAVARAMAREAIDHLDQLNEAILGL